MSRIGKLPITLPEGVKAEISGRNVKITGPKGELSYKLNPEIEVTEKDGKLIVGVKKQSKNSASFYGLSRTILDNMVKGVSEGFEKQLEFKGVGFRAKTEGQNLILNVGFSHPIEYSAKEGIEINVEKNIISVSGVDKQLVGQTAAEIREIKKPEPYKGKGIKYVGEKIRRKAGKVAAKAS